MDPIANMLTSILNSRKAKKPARIPASNIKLKILETLKNEGLITSITVSKQDAALIVEPSHKHIEKIVRLSKPGRRLYVKAKQIRPKPGILRVLSTPSGILTDAQARKSHLGGELLFEVRT